MYKILSIAISSLFLLTQCGSLKGDVIPQEAGISQPDFAKKTAYFNSYTAGVEGGGTGYEIHFENFTVPENILLERAYFAGHTGVISKSANGFFARVQKIPSSKKDVIMSSDVTKEAVNTPPEEVVKFLVTLKEDQVGIKYLDNGVTMYAIMDSVLQREPIFYPSAAPKSDRQ